MEIDQGMEMIGYEPPGVYDKIGPLFNSIKTSDKLVPVRIAPKNSPAMDSPGRDVMNHAWCVSLGCRGMTTF